MTVRDLGAFWWKEGVRNCMCTARCFVSYVSKEIKMSGA